MLKVHIICSLFGGHISPGIKNKKPNQIEWKIIESLESVLKWGMPHDLFILKGFGLKLAIRISMTLIYYYTAHYIEQLENPDLDMNISYFERPGFGNNHTNNYF